MAVRTCHTIRIRSLMPIGGAKSPNFCEVVHSDTTFRGHEPTDEILTLSCEQASYALGFAREKANGNKLLRQTQLGYRHAGCKNGQFFG